MVALSSFMLPCSRDQHFGLDVYGAFGIVLSRSRYLRRPPKADCYAASAVTGFILALKIARVGPLPSLEHHGPCETRSRSKPYQMKYDTVPSLTVLAYAPVEWCNTSRWMGAPTRISRHVREL